MFNRDFFVEFYGRCIMMNLSIGSINSKEINPYHILPQRVAEVIPYYLNIS